VQAWSKSTTGATNSQDKKGFMDGHSAVRRKQKQSSPKDKNNTYEPAYLQAKLAVAPANDPLEQEADALADKIAALPFNPEDDFKQSFTGNAQTSPSMSAPDALKSVQRKAKSTDSVHHAEVDNSGVSDNPTTSGVIDEQIQRSAKAQTTVAPVDETREQNIAQLLEQTKSSGEPLGEQLQQHFGRLLSADLSHVIVHTDSTAAYLCESLNARAFAQSYHIYFASGEYAPNTAKGRWLIAHELTHVLQQGAAGEGSIMKVRTPASSDQPAASADEAAPSVNQYKNSNGEIDTATKVIKILTLQVPFFKAKFYQANNADPKLGDVQTWRRNESTGGDKRNTDQATKWENSVKTQVDANLETKFTQAQRTEQSGRYIYYFSYASGSSYLIGTQAEIKRRCRRPLWTEEGFPKSYHVDHQIEHQTCGSDEVSNMFLLEGRINVKSGGDIRSEIRTKVGAFVAEMQGEVENPPESTDDARANYVIYFSPVGSGLAPSGELKEKDQYYDRDHIMNGDHLAPLHPMTQQEIDASGMMAGDADNIHLFPSAVGGYHYKATKQEGGGYLLDVNTMNGQETKNFDISAITYDSQTKEGSIDIMFPSQSLAETFTPHLTPRLLNPVTISPKSGITWGGRFNKNSLVTQVRDGMKVVNSMSPLAITDVDMNAQGICVNGIISPTLPLIENSDVNFSLNAEELRIFKTFQSEDINLPSPFSIEQTSLTLGASNNGLSVAGQVAFGIEKVGKGQISALGEANFDHSSAVSLSGHFDFDERIFGAGNSAQVRVGYANEQWSMGGTLRIIEGKIKGVRSATIIVEYSESEGFKAIGEAQLSIPGVESGRLEISQSEEEGLAVKGDFALSSQTPGIRGGAISVALVEREDGTGFALSASGEAVPDIPGIDSNLLISYDDGAFTAQADATYERGMLSGGIQVGVTNRSVTEEGALSDTAEEGNPLIVYGGGELTLELAPWLQGTAGVVFAPDGEITVSGEIGIPEELQIFPRKELSKSIFNIAIQAPIFPGIVAEVGGGLGAQAGIGPGVIDQLRLGIVYNPAHEDQTTITGNAHLKIPADAGLRLSVRAGIGLGITGASATGGIDIGGTLGIAGAAEAAVDLNWTPVTGLDIAASVSVMAQPSFTFDIGGYVDVRALGFSVYDNRWEFASYTFGSDYQFGICLPVHYQEGEPFDISLSDVEFKVPNINTEQLLKSLIARIA
jgi:hypothetical protein